MPPKSQEYERDWVTVSQPANCVGVRMSGHFQNPGRAWVAGICSQKGKHFSGPVTCFDSERFECRGSDTVCLPRSRVRGIVSFVVHGTLPWVHHVYGWRPVWYYHCWFASWRLGELQWWGAWKRRQCQEQWEDQGHKREVGEGERGRDREPDLLVTSIVILYFASPLASSKLLINLDCILVKFPTSGHLTCTKWTTDVSLKTLPIGRISLHPCSGGKMQNRSCSRVTIS